jgi:hypothetical protein
MYRLVPTLLVTAFVMALPTHGYAASYKLDFTPIGEQRSRMDSGLEAIESNLEKSSVKVVEIDERVRKRGFVRLFVYNASDKSFNFGPENVRAELTDGTAVPIVGYDKLIKEEKNRQMWAAIATGLSAASNSLAAANSGTTYGYVGRTPISIYSPSSAYVAQSLVNRENDARFAALAVNGAAAMEALSVNIRTTTVDPGSSFGGGVVFELPKQARSQKIDVPIRFIMMLGSDEHIIQGVIKRSK